MKVKLAKDLLKNILNGHATQIRDGKLQFDSILIGNTKILFECKGTIVAYIDVPFFSWHKGDVLTVEFNSELPITICED
jgi:hypothetical protein